MTQNEEQITAATLEPHGRMHIQFGEIALRRLPLVVLGVVVALVLGSLYYSMRAPVYRSDAQVLLIRKQPNASPITGADPRLGYYEDYLSTHQVLMKSPLIIDRALQKPELQGLKSLAEFDEPMRGVLRSLTVTRELKESAGNNNILNLSFRGKVASECATVLTAIIQSYKDFLDETYKNVSDDTLQLISKASEVLQKDLAKKQQDYRDFRQKAPLLWKGKEGANLYQEKLTVLDSKRTTLLIRRADLQGRLASIEKGLKEGRSRAAVLATLPDLPTMSGGSGLRQASFMTLQEQLYPLQRQEQILLQDYGPNHPRVQAIRKQIELAQQQFAQPVDAVNAALAKLEKGGEELVLDPLEIYIQSLKQDLQDVQMSEQLLTEDFRNANDEARQLINFEIQDEVSRGEIARTHQLYDSIIQRLKEINVVRDFGGYQARTIAPAHPGVRVEPSGLLIFTTASLLGILSGLGLAFLADWSDKSFRSPQEIRRRLGLPIVGHIPLMKSKEALKGANSEDATVDPLLWAYYRPRSQEAESYRGVRTALYFSMSGMEHAVVQITSPEMGDGKSTLAANLGISIAQSGKKILLIDADFRRPRLHKVFGLSAEVGFATVIQGKAELKDAIQESLVPNLSILPCGAIPLNPAELLTSPRVTELLDTIRMQYDFVLIDTPPLLAVTDPCVVAQRVDAILLTIRISKNGRPNAERAKEILATLGVTVLGVVVNGIDRRTRAGGYGYGYEQYRYSQGYSEANSSSYYSENGEEGHYPDAAMQATLAATNSPIVKPSGEDKDVSDRSAPVTGTLNGRPGRKRRHKRSESNLFRRLLGLR